MINKSSSAVTGWVISTEEALAGYAGPLDHRDFSWYLNSQCADAECL